MSNYFTKCHLNLHNIRFISLKCYAFSLNLLILCVNIVVSSPKYAIYHSNHALSFRKHLNSEQNGAPIGWRLNGLLTWDTPNAILWAAIWPRYFNKMLMILQEMSTLGPYYHVFSSNSGFTRPNVYDISYLFTQFHTNQR
jgi:hypothetical protein